MNATEGERVENRSGREGSVPINLRIKPKPKSSMWLEASASKELPSSGACPFGVRVGDVE